jgi:hypothetical protein
MKGVGSRGRAVCVCGRGGLMIGTDLVAEELFVSAPAHHQTAVPVVSTPRLHSEWSRAVSAE